MLKRIFLLALAIAIGWLIWYWLRQRQQAFDAATPQLAPLGPAAGATPPPSVPQPSAQEHAPAPAAEARAGEAAGPDEMRAEQPASAPVPAEPQLPAQGEPSPADTASSAPAIETAPANEPQAARALGPIVGYCVRCKTRRPIAGAHAERTESGRRAARGTCPVCGANMFTFLPAE